jgi:hypothetical protein
MKLFNSILCLFVFFATYSQNQQYNVVTIPDNLIENANSVVRLNYKNIEISSRKLMTISTKRVVTIFNERGLESMDAAEYFSSSSKIKSIEAVILNKEGAEIKRIKRRDFKENSVSEGSVVTDNKLLFLDYTPIM